MKMTPNSPDQWNQQGFSQPTNPAPQAPVNPYQPNPNPNPNPYAQPMRSAAPAGGVPGQGASVASLVCGILSIVFCWCYGIVGLILGIVALVMYNGAKNQTGGMPNGMAKAGFICGLIGSILSALYLIYYILVILFWQDLMRSIF